MTRLASVPGTGPPGSGRTATASRATASAAASADMPTIPAYALPQRPAHELIELARRGVLEAAEESSDGLRFATAHLAALRAAAAVLAAKARPVRSRRRRPVAVWALLAKVAPEMAEWAAFFAVTATKRAAAEAGLPQAVTAREADDLLRDVKRFLAVVEITLGQAHQPLLERVG